LAALVKLLPRRPDVRLQLAGPGDHEWALCRLGPDRPAAEAAIDVLGTAPHEEIARRYREATVTVLPSHSEAFGIVLIESLASGTPVVCSESGGMPEIVDRPEVGRAVPWGDADALADALHEAIELAADPATPKRCAEHARRWDWERSIGPAHEALYRSVARGQQRRA
jgi:glycosyltransferase involved in cell wall biosynthesis